MTGEGEPERQAHTQRSPRWSLAAAAGLRRRTRCARALMPTRPQWPPSRSARPSPA